MRHAGRARVAGLGSTQSAGLRASWHDACFTLPMRCAERLRSEHAFIQEVLLALEGVRPTVAPVSGAVEFLGAFVERCHEAKEERVLVPMLRAAGLVDGETERAIANDHAEGARLLGELRSACRRRNSDAEAANLLAAYAALQRRHIAFENASILPAIGRLRSDDDARMHDACERIDEQVVGPGGRDVLLALGCALLQACRASRNNNRPTTRALTACDVMRPVAGAARPEYSLSHAVDVMESLGRRELPVVDDGRLVGIIARSDVEPYRGHLEWTPVRAAMASDLVTVAPDTPVGVVARTLIDRDLNALPVASDGQLVGMIRRSDMLGVFLRVLDQ